MKFSRLLPLSFCAALVLVMAACSNNNDTGTTTAGEQFSFKQGDYSVYNLQQLDSTNNPVPDSTFRVTRTVIRTGVTLDGQNDAALILDSTFAIGSTTRAISIDSLYFRVANNEVYWYFDTRAIGQFLPNSGLLDFSGVPLTGFQPKWIKFAELRDAASTQEFSANDFSATVDITGLGPLNIVARISAKGLGKTTLSLNNTSYSVHKQSSSITLTVTTPFGALPIPTIASEYNFGIPTENNTPRTIITQQTNTVVATLPILGPQVLNGERRTLVSFRAGI
jgi:hypothetical protein